MKKLLISLMLITFSFFVFAKTGPMAGEKDLKVVKTKWFDIIYPERCYKSASILYQNVDHIFEEVSDEYGLEPFGRMPIVITPAVEQLNAFFTNMPYNHIVLYDTSNDSLGELSVFSEDLLCIFRHELTHAVTFNMLNKTNQKMAKIFGDGINAGTLLNVTTGMAEGATVSEESARGEGRLNDEYAKHSVKQAKIERKFPSYYDIQGAGDLNPYYFNGAFHEWIQNRYGMEAYAKFWYYTVNSQGLTVAKRYKKAFGSKLKTDWQIFIEEYEVPKIPDNPVANDIVKDFFEPNAYNYSNKNNAGSRYTKLTSSNKKLYWIDGMSSSIYTSQKKLENQSEKTPYKKLFTQQGVYNISSSLDDKYLAISYYSNISATTQAKVKIYDTQTKQFYIVEDKGLKDAGIIYNGQDYFLVASKFVTPNNSFQILKILTKDNGRIYGVEKIKEVILPVNQFTSNYVDINDSKNNGMRFAFIKKDKLTFSICIYFVDNERIKEYIVPEEKMVIHSLSFFNEEDDSNDGDDVQKLYFSWAKEGTMPRDGFLTFDDNFDSNESGVFNLSKTDISGGVFTPVATDINLVYVGHFLNQNRMFTLELDFENGYDEFIVENTFPLDDNIQVQIEEIENFPLQESKKYNSFDYMKKGIFIPAYLYTDQYISKTEGVLPCLLTIGATYITANPWTSGTSDIIGISAAYNAFYNRFDFDFLTSAGSDTSLIQTSTEITTGISLVDGWDSSKLNFMIGSGFNFGRISSFSINNIVNSAIYSDFYYSIADQLSFIYSNVHFTGPGTYEKCGLETKIGGLFVSQDFLDDEKLSIPFGYELFTSVYGYIPKLLPFESTYGLTLNLPTKIGLELFPVENNLHPLEFMRFTEETILFGQLIKHAIPFIKGIFLQNWNISFGYQGSLVLLEENIYKSPQYLHFIEYLSQTSDGQFLYKDKIYLKAALILSPNIGTFANRNIQASLFTKYNLNLHPNKNEQVFRIDLGIDLKL